MESCDFVDSIKLEKANALARYRTFSNISKLFQLIEFSLAVAVISWSSTRLPLVFKFSGEYFAAFSSYFMNQLVVFLVVNVIVVVCCLLSRYSDSVSNCYHDGCNDQNPESELAENENPIVNKTESEVIVETAVNKEKKQILKYQRTKSDMLKSEIPVKSRRELRRSVTEMRRNTAVNFGGEVSTVKSFEAVEELSNEEFRIAVERFISKQLKFLKEQSMVEE